MENQKKETAKEVKEFIHQKINLRNELINCIIKDAENRLGGKNNATVKSIHFRNNAGITANKLVNGKK